MSYIVWFPFFPSYSSNQKYQNPSLGKKTNPSIQSQKPLPRLSDPGRFFFVLFLNSGCRGILKLDTPPALIFKHHKGEKKTEKQKSIQMQWCPRLLPPSSIDFFKKKKSYLWGDTRFDTMNSIWTPGRATGENSKDQLTKTAGWKVIGDPEWRCRKYFLPRKWGYIIEY